MFTVYQNLVTMMILLTNWALSPLKITTTDKVRVFKQGITDVKAKVDKINLLRQMLDITGTAADKKKLKNILCDITIIITYPVRGFAFTTKIARQGARFIQFAGDSRRTAQSTNKPSNRKIKSREKVTRFIF